MPKGVGRLIEVGIKPEAVRGTPEASPSYWLPWSTFSYENKDVKILDDQAVGRVEDSLSESITKQFAEIKISAPVTDYILPYLLYGVLGSKAVATHAGETIVYDHTLTKINSAQLPSFSLFYNDPVGGQDKINALAVMTDLELSYEVGKFMEFTAGFRAKQGANATLAPSYTPMNRFVQKHVTFKLATNKAGLAAASAISVKTLKLKINPNVEDDDVLGSLSPRDFVAKQFSIDGEVELMFEDNSYKDLALNNTVRAARIDLLNSDVTIGTGSNPQIRIDLTKITFEDVTRSINLNGIVFQTLKFKAHYSIADSEMVSALGVNTLANLT